MQLEGTKQNFQRSINEAMKLFAHIRFFLTYLSFKDVITIQENHPPFPYSPRIEKKKEKKKKQKC